MKALILAAGEGRRLRPLTDNIPKCLVRFHGRPLIDYQLEVFRACNIHDIVVVKGYMAGNFHREGVRFVVNNQYDQTNMVYSLFCAEREMDDDIIISYGDIKYSRQILKKLINEPEGIAITVDTKWHDLWKLRMANPLLDAETLKLDKDSFVTELGKKPQTIHEIQGQYMGLIKIRRTHLQKIIRFYHSLDKTRSYDGKTYFAMYMTSFLQELINAGFRVKGVPVNGGWLEIDTLTDLDQPLDGV